VSECADLLYHTLVLLAHPYAGRWDPGPLWPARLDDPGGLIALVGVTASFTGIELPTVLAEEARDPRRTVARATRIAVAVTGGLYAVSAWALPAATGTDNIRAAAGEHGSLLLFTLVTPHIPGPLVQLGQLLLVTSVFAAVVAFHTTSTRYLFALAREHVLPARLGAVNRAGAPASASQVHSAATLAVLAAYALTGAEDPLRHLLLWGTVTGGFGVTILMAATSFAAARHLTGHRAGYGLWTRRIAPTTAAVLLTAVLAFSLTQLPVLFGTTSAWTWALPGVYLGATGIGLATAAHLHLRHPHTLTGIGHGTHAPAPTPLTPRATPRTRRHPP
jgi:amino acid transporter